MWWVGGRKEGVRKGGRDGRREGGKKNGCMASHLEWAQSGKPELDACSAGRRAHMLTEIAFAPQPLRVSTGPGTGKLSQGSEHKARVLHQTRNGLSSETLPDT